MFCLKSQRTVGTDVIQLYGLSRIRKGAFIGDNVKRLGGCGFRDGRCENGQHQQQAGMDLR